MATRSNTRIIYPDGTTQIYYKHHDGYPEGVGYDLREMAINYGIENIPDELNANEEYRDYGHYNSDVNYIYTVDLKDRVIYYTKNKNFLTSFDDKDLEDMDHIIIWYED